jgi:hypothetical protein
MVPLLRTFFRLKGNEKEANAYIVGDPYAKKHSHHVKWWRRGLLERLEKSEPGTPSKLHSITTFNGQILRILHYQEAAPFGFVYSAERYGWLSKNRVDPFEFLYVSYNANFSEIVAKGKDFRLDKERRGGQDYVRVTVRHPVYESGGYELLFGKGGLLVERRLFGVKEKKKTRQWVVEEITSLSNYRRCELPQGGILWFPFRAVIGHYVGQLPDGRLVQWKTQTVTVKDLRFNVDIPGEKFALEFPKDMKVFDGLTGQDRWLEPGVRPAAVFYPEAQARNRLWWIVGTSVAGVVLLGAFFYFVRRKWRTGLAKS